MNDILGNYVIRASLNNLLQDYALTGTDRNADLVTVDYTKLSFGMAFLGYGANGQVRFKRDNKIFLKRVRVITPGCAGLRPALGSIAAKFSLVPCDSSATELNGRPIELYIDKFNEWQDIGAWYDPNNVTSLNPPLTEDEYYFKAAYQNSGFYIDDYNIQSAYIGEKVKAYLEIELDTAGLVSVYTGGVI